MMFQKDGGMLAYLRSHIIAVILQRRLAVDASKPLALLCSLCVSL